MRICRVCGVSQDDTGFKKSPLTSDGFENICKPCDSAAQKERREANKRRKKPMVSEKRCSTCGEIKVGTEFGIKSDTADGLAYSCKSCLRKIDKERWHKRKAHQKNYVLQKTYGITSDDYEKMLAEQEGKCKICGSEILDVKGRSLAVDHCHSTGKVRGLLCSNCNLGIGSFKDDVTLLEKAIEYLR